MNLDSLNDIPMEGPRSFKVKYASLKSYCVDEI